MTLALERLQREIRACTKCVAGGYLKEARPIVAGRVADRVMIVGQAPGDVEVREGRPFAGRSGDTLRRWLAEAGLSLDEVYRSAVTKCYPGKARNGAGDRRPSPAEIALCAPWLEQEVGLLRPAVILLVGTLAIERFWRDAAPGKGSARRRRSSMGKVALEAAVGRSRRDERGTLLIPLPHPSGTSRWLNDPAHQTLLQRALGVLRREVRRLRSG